MSSTDIGLASGWCFLIYSSTNHLEQEFQTQWMTRGYALWISWWIWRWKWSRKNRGLQSYYEVHFCRHKCIKTGRSWQVSSEDGKVTIPPLPPLDHGCDVHNRTFNKYSKSISTFQPSQERIVPTCLCTNCRRQSS